MKKILAISGSLRTGSSNHAILTHLQAMVPSGVEYIIYNNLAQIPAFDPGRDTEEPPVTVVELRSLLANANGIVICTPEYAFGVPGTLKNMLDWMVSSSSFVDKPVALITASLGGEHAHASLLLTLGALSANVVTGASFIISFIRSKINADGQITDAVTVKNLQDAWSYFLNIV